MSSKAEIEAQIAALQAQLHEHLTYDPAFTPAELVRWDPSLVGTVLHIQHELDIPANAFKQVFQKGPSVDAHDLTHAYGTSDPSSILRYTGEKVINSDKVMEMSGILKSKGIYHIKAIRSTTEIYYFMISNKFDLMTLLPLLPETVEDDPLARLNVAKYNLNCKELGMYLNVLDDPYIPTKIYNWILPLANPARPLLDQIYIATQTHMRGRDIITDKYPLSTLYQEWKGDKAAGRLHRCTPLDEAMRTIHVLQEELRLAREARDSSEAYSEKLRGALHASAGIKDLENPM